MTFSRWSRLPMSLLDRMLSRPSKGKRMRSHHRRGSTLVYCCVATFAMAGFVAFGVDWGRVQLTKSELRAAADAAARYAVSGLQNDLSGNSAAASNAALSVAQNKANGRAIVFNAAEDMVIGVWSKSARTFTPNSDLNAANAVKITLKCVAARGTSVPMTFLSALGRPQQDVQAISIAMIDYTGSVGGAGNGRYEYFIPATSNPWLAGMPSGSTASTQNAHNNPDYAGTTTVDSGTTKNADTGRGYTTGGSTDANSANSNYAAWGGYAAKKASPIQAGGITVSGGSPITMDGVNGGANNSSASSNFDADGGAAVWNVPYEQYRSYVYGGYASYFSENGISNIHAPINSVIGVFLDDSKPSTTSAPDPLDFSTSDSRDFKSLSPKLKQPFFIGDGRTSAGEVQQFVPPTGSTRLFICTMDEYEWSNNQGGFYVTAHAKGHIVTVK